MDRLEKIVVASAIAVTSLVAGFGGYYLSRPSQTASAMQMDNMQMKAREDEKPSTYKLMEKMQHHSNNNCEDCYRGCR